MQQITKWRGYFSHLSGACSAAAAAERGRHVERDDGTRSSWRGRLRRSVLRTQARRGPFRPDDVATPRRRIHLSLSLRPRGHRTYGSRWFDSDPGSPSSRLVHRRGKRRRGKLRRSALGRHGVVCVETADLICCARLLDFLAHVSLLPKGSSSSISYGNCAWNLLAGQCLSHKQTCLAMVKVLSSK